MGKERNIRLDLVKAIAIICVVLGHTCIAYPALFVNLFHVGVFFAVSGIFFREEYTDTPEGLGKVIVKRIKRLYLPYVFYNFFYLCIRNLMILMGLQGGALLSLKLFVRHVLEIAVLIGGEEIPGPGWFIRSLFILEVVFAVSDFLIKKASGRYHRVFRWILACVCLGIGYYMHRSGIVLPTDNFDVPLNIGTIFSCWILFVAGMDLPKLLRKIPLPKGRMLYDIIAAAASFALLVIIEPHGGITFSSNIYSSIPYFLGCVALGFILCYSLAGLLSRTTGIVRRFFLFTGKSTLEILMVHLLGFKIVTVIYILANNLPRSGFKAFPVFTTDIWYIYLIVGLAFSLAFAFVWGRIKEGLKNKLGSKRIFVYVVLAVLLAAVPQAAQGGVIKFMAKFPDYSVVYDMDYYLDHNPDLAEYFGENPDPDAVLQHFIQNGMSEGRTASRNFIPQEYRDMYPDLDAAFGDDWEQYYRHFMSRGALEQRYGSRSTIINEYETQLTASQDLNGKLVLTFKTANGKTKDYEILALPAYENDLKNGFKIDEGIFADGVSTVYELGDINYKYVSARKVGENYEQTSNFAYIDNAGVYSTAADNTFKIKDKKGIQMAEGMVDDVLDLEAGTAFTNLILSKIMDPVKQQGSVAYTHKGKTYYFNKEWIDRLDGYFSRLTANHVAVTCGVITYFDESFREIYYPAAFEPNSAAFYALNTSTKEGMEYTEAFVSFLSERYDGSDPGHGLITNWVVGNEVNESGTYNYMGEKSISDYLTEYIRTFRIIYNIVKNNIPGAQVYVPLEPWWGIGSNMLTYGGRDFLTLFSEMTAAEGNIDWGLAYHAYSYPLSDPKVQNDDERTIDETGELTLDGYFTTDTDKSVIITMKNIEVLVEFMHKQNMLNSKGEVRSIILSEQGYTSNSNVYGNCEALQAASMTYAYYKAEMIDEIDSFIYFLQADNDDASMGNNYYLFGLWGNEDGKKAQKLSHRVFRYMDSSNTLEELSFVKQILGIKDWSEEIENFDPERFESMDEKEGFDEGKTDLSDAVVSDIPRQHHTGEELLPEITVTLDGKTLVSDRDYDVVYLNNTEPGTAFAVIVGIGDYTGTKQAAFAIE